MKPNPVINIKSTQEEISLIDKVTMDFIIAIMTKDIKAMEKLLHDEFKYINNFNKWETLTWFTDQFNQEIPEQFLDMKVKEYVCSGYQCGNRSLMFHHGYFPIIDEFGNPPKTLTLAFESGKLKDISICYNYLSVEQIIERSKLN